MMTIYLNEDDIFKTKGCFSFEMSAIKNCINEIIIKLKILMTSVTILHMFSIPMHFVNKLLVKFRKSRKISKE